MSDPDFDHLFEDCPGLPGGCPRCAEIFDDLARYSARPKPLADPDQSFTCPDCKAVSHHYQDVINSYCGRCHAFKWEEWRPARCMEPTCPDFGDYDFGQATCPSEHATPPAKRGNSRIPAGPR